MTPGKGVAMAGLAIGAAYLTTTGFVVESSAMWLACMVVMFWAA
jgi:hypothetical protein